MSKNISIVIPVNNEEGNISELYAKLKKVLDSTAQNYEIIFIDDGSEDKTYLRLLEIYSKDECVNIIKLSNNFGQSISLSAGFHYARGKVIISMDGDLQHDSEDIPMFLDKINSGYGLVNGWKKKSRWFFKQEGICIAF